MIDFSENQLEELRTYYLTQLDLAIAKKQELHDILQRINSSTPKSVKGGKSSTGSFKNPGRKAKSILTVETRQKKRGPKAKVSAVEIPKKRPGRPPAIKTEVKQQVIVEPVSNKKTLKTQPAIRKTRKTAKETPGKPALAQVVASVKEAANLPSKAVKREKKPVSTDKPVSRRKLALRGGVKKLPLKINLEYVNSLLTEPILKTEEVSDQNPIGVLGLD